MEKVAKILKELRQLTEEYLGELDLTLRDQIYARYVARACDDLEKALKGGE